MSFRYVFLNRVLCNLHTYRHSYIYIYIYMSTYVHIDISLHIQHVCTCIYMHMFRSSLCVCNMYIYICAYVYIIYIYIHTCTCILTYVHGYILCFYMHQRPEDSMVEVADSDDEAESCSSSGATVEHSKPMWVRVHMVISISIYTYHKCIYIYRHSNQWPCRSVMLLSRAPQHRTLAWGMSPRGLQSMTYTYIYICIYMFTDRQTDKHMYMYIYVCVCKTRLCYIYIYIYIYIAYVERCEHLQRTIYYVYRRVYIYIYI